MLGGRAFLSELDGHHASVLLNRAWYVPRLAEYTLEAVICESAIGAGPFTKGVSIVHVGA